VRRKQEFHESPPWPAAYVKDWSRLSVGLRRQLARIAPASRFQQVLSDGNDEVLEAFLDNPGITQGEVLVVIDRARSQNLLVKISRTPRWYANHTIKRRLLGNPLTPYRVACRILDYLPFVELRRVMGNTNMPREVRNKARECFRQAFVRLSDAETTTLFLSTEGRLLRELTALTSRDKRVLLRIMHRAKPPRGLVLDLARSPITPPEVLQLIGRKSAWAMDTAVRRALLSNSKTPQHVKDSLTGKDQSARGRR
jgi:hypothetical protein